MQYFHQMLVSKELGGAGLIALQIAAAMRERVRESYVWIPGQGPAATKAEEMGVAWRLYDPTQALASSRLRSALCNWTISQLLRPQCPGVIHVHSPFYYGMLLLGLKVSRLKSVVHIHLEEEKEGLRWALRRPPDVIITCARFLVEQVRSVLPKRRQDTQQIVAIPNAIDTERFYPGDKIIAKTWFGVATQTPLVLMVANLAPHKGQETALRTAAILRKKGMIAQFWFVGAERGGSDKFTTRLHALASDLGLTDQVRFLGQRKDIAELLRAADVFILPSTAEGLPLSILEAQASGVPVLAAPTAGIPEVVINGKTGFLVAANDPAGYAYHLESLLHNRDLYAQMAKVGHTKVLEEYSWKTYIERVWAIYQPLSQN